MTTPFANGIRRKGAVIGIALLALSGCALDPFTREGNWRPSGVNEANLRMMVADPRDYQQGASERGSDGQLGSEAVARFRNARSSLSNATETGLPTTSSAGGLRTSTGGTN